MTDRRILGLFSLVALITLGTGIVSVVLAQSDKKGTPQGIACPVHESLTQEQLDGMNKHMQILEDQGACGHQNSNGGIMGPMMGNWGGR